MHRITIDDLSFCVMEPEFASQVCGGFDKEVYSGTGKGAWSASADNAYNTAYKAGYIVSKKKGTVDAGVDVSVAYGTAGAVAASVSDGEQYVKTRASVTLSI